jgi:hypothetical protein
MPDFNGDDTDAAPCRARSSVVGIGRSIESGAEL